MSVTAEASLEEWFEREYSHQIFFKGCIFSFKSVGVPIAESLIATSSDEVQSPTALVAG